MICSLPFQVTLCYNWVENPQALHEDREVMLEASPDFRRVEKHPPRKPSILHLKMDLPAEINVDSRHWSFHHFEEGFRHWKLCDFLGSMCSFSGVFSGSCFWGNFVPYFCWAQVIWLGFFSTRTRSEDWTEVYGNTTFGKRKKVAWNPEGCLLVQHQMSRFAMIYLVLDQAHAPPKFNIEPENGWFPIGISCLRGPFSGSMLVFGGRNLTRNPFGWRWSLFRPNDI